MHRTDPPVTLRVVESPISGDWLVRVEGWDVPEHFPLLYHSLEAAQRAADDVLIYYQPHDCWQAGCEEWAPVQAAMQRTPERSM